MAKTPHAYTRLARPSASIGSSSSLWLANDHLLQVVSTGYTERYLRFYFGDIQGFIVGESKRRLIWNFVWGGAAVIPAVIVISALTSGETPVASAICLFFPVAFLIWNSLLGPTCRVHLISKVQTVRLSALSRRRRMEAVLGRLQPLIEAAQADLLAPTPAASASASTPTSGEIAPPSSAS